MINLNIKWCNHFCIMLWFMIVHESKLVNVLFLCICAEVEMGRLWERKVSVRGWHQWTQLLLVDQSAVDMFRCADCMILFLFYFATQVDVRWTDVEIMPSLSSVCINVKFIHLFIYSRLFSIFILSLYFSIFPVIYLLLYMVWL